ncbi:MAG: DpnI domain-containing protein [Bacteroidales bacterium]
MNLHFDLNLTKSYHSNSQRARVLTENWIKENLFCPICGANKLSQFKNNSPVADFYCENCNEQYELKSKENKRGNIGREIVDGAYSTMIERINSQHNPNFLFLTYSNNSVNNLIIIPNHFFTPDIIEKRKPLNDNARRAGWVGCNINIETIPNSGKIYRVNQGVEIYKDDVISN